MPVDKETQDTIGLALEEFRRKYGRDPYPDEPIFSDLGHPEHVEAAVVDAMKRAGIDPALIYAFEKTGRLVTADNLDKLPDRDLREWQEAVREYRRRIAQGDAPDV